MSKTVIFITKAPNCDIAYKLITGSDNIEIQRTVVSPLSPRTSILEFSDSHPVNAEEKLNVLALYRSYLNAQLATEQLNQYQLETNQLPPEYTES